jgi:hypothetical protein
LQVSPSVFPPSNSVHTVVKKEYGIHHIFKEKSRSA